MTFDEINRKYNKKMGNQAQTGSQKAATNPAVGVAAGIAANTARAAASSGFHAIGEKYMQRIQSRGLTGGVDSDYINRFYTDYNRMVQSYKADYDKAGFGNALSIYSDYNKAGNDMRERGSNIKAYLYANRNQLDEQEYTDLVKQIDEILNTYSGVERDFLNKERFALQFDSEEAYDKAIREIGYQQKYDGKSYDELLGMLGDLSQDSEEYTWLQSYAPSAMTLDDYKRKISDTENQIAWYQSKVDEIEFDETAGAYHPEYKDLKDQKKKLEDELEQLKAGKWQLSNREKYGAIQNQEDFQKVSSEVPEERTAKFGIQVGDTFYGVGDSKYDYINDINGEREFMRYSGDGNARGDAAYYKYSFMEPTEVSTYNYLYHTEGKQAAEDYLSYLEYTLDERRMQKVAGGYRTFSNEHPVLASAVSVPMNLVSGIGILDIALQNIGKNIKEAATGEYAGPINYNSVAMTPTVGTSAIRGTVAQNIADATGTISLDPESHPFWSRIFNGKSLGDIYQLGMSMADSAAIAALSPILGGGGTLLLGGSAASQGVLDALEAGATDSQALFMGLLNGTFETFFEEVSLENILTGNPKNLFLGILKQGGIEGSEELFTTLANTAADVLVMAEKSNIQKAIAEYRKNGQSEGDAIKQALLDACIQAGWDFVGGAISGGVMGAAAYPVQNYQYNSEQGRQLYGADPGALVQEGLELNPKSGLAAKMNQRLQNGKDVSGHQLYSLAKQNEKAIQREDVETIRNAAAQRLTELGETGNVDALATAIARQTSGEKLSKAELQTITDSRYGQRVVNELNPDNITSGDYSTAWAEKLDTSRINVEEYSRLVEAAQTAQEPEKTRTGMRALLEDYEAQEAQSGAAEVSEEGKAEVKASPVTQKPAAPLAAPVSEARAQGQAVTEKKAVTLEEASKKYGAQAGAMLHTYNQGQDVEQYDSAYGMAYEMGKAGVSLGYTKGSASVSYLTETQRELAWEAGKAAADSFASAREQEISGSANGKTGWKTGGVVRGEGVTLSDLRSAYHDQRGIAYKTLSAISKATGLTIVLTKSEVKDGKFQGAQGEYRRKSEPGTIYIDINAGLTKLSDVDQLSKYTLLRTFTHEFTHFIENWSPREYNELRRAVFAAMEQKGADIEQFIANRQKGGMSYDAASREVVAEALTDILPDSGFAETLAEQHRGIFEKLLEKIRDFLGRMRDYFNQLVENPSGEAALLKEQAGENVRYLEGIVKRFDEAAVKATENYQSTVAVDTAAETRTETRTETRAESADDAGAVTAAETESVAPSVKSVTETTENTEKVSEPYVSENGYTIEDNAEFGTLEIRFDGKPSEAVRNALKENKFRWHNKKKVWYGKADRDTIVSALDKVYAGEKEALEKAGEALRKSKEDMKAWRESITPKQDAQEPAAEPTFAEIFESATREEKDEVLRAIDENMGKPTHVFPTEIREEAPIENKEVTEDGKESENGPDDGAVQQPVRSGEGAARLLAGVETGPVQGGREGRGSVRASELQGTEDAGRNGQTDAAGDVQERGTRDRVGGHLQQLSDSGTGGERPGTGLSGAVQEERSDHDGRGTGRLGGELSGVTSETLHEEVRQEIEKKSRTQPKGQNFTIGESLDLPSGNKARVRANLDAIRLVKKLQAEGRYATAEEQKVLSKYVGWGGLADAFGRSVSNRETRKLEYQPVSGLEKEFEELREILTEDEYKAARGSTNNAHYTSVEVIRAMYDGLAGLGFQGGRMLEPSAGVGSFVGAMPAELSGKVKSWTMVELDSITGQIAKYLYPNADVRIQGFEETNIPDGYMDVAIGNVPFGDYAIQDKKYPKGVTKAIHNYFFAKALDKVRTGGIVMFITSSFTMDSRGEDVRRYIMQRADLLGAVRLPDTAFKGNAGTEVVTDILILKKRAERTEYRGEAFLSAPWKNVSGYNGGYVNEYFQSHPEMVLGTPEMSGSMYGRSGLTYKALTDQGSLGDQIRRAIGRIQTKMDYPAAITPEKSNYKQASAKRKARTLQVNNGVIQTRDENGNLETVETDADTAARIKGMVSIRETYTELCDALQQGVRDSEAAKLRKALNGVYDRFVKQYGYLNSPKNRRAIRQFADSYSILSLEDYDEKKKTAKKTDIFRRNTILANRTAASAENVEEGLTISLNTTGEVDVSLIARLTGERYESVERQLIDQRLVFKDRDGKMIPAVQYLSGNVRAKLREAEGLVGIDPDYRNNVEALRAVVPATIPYTDIHVNPGATWVPASVYEDFVSHILNRTNRMDYRTRKNIFQVEFIPETNEYRVTINDAWARQSAENTQTWGESGKTFAAIFENMLNGRRTNVYSADAEGNRVLDKVRTEAVSAKAEKLGDEFRKWLWSDEGRRGEMQELYNEAFNAIVTPKYSGAGLSVNGMNSEMSLREHQADAVARILNSGGNTLLAHRVGAGKTMEMAAAAMKLKQLGVVKKPMFVVPNNVTAQWGKEFLEYFPAANILLIGDADMTPAERMTTINRIKNNDYDAVIIPYTRFEKIQMSSEWRKNFYEEQISRILFAINAEKESGNGKGFSVKQLEKKRKQLEGRIKRLTDKAKDEDGAMFEDLGVDALFVDEAHNFKNLEYTTRMSNVAGLGNQEGSQRAFDIYTKVRYLQQLNGGRGIVFATATPVMNSMTEMYIMQRYLQPDTLESLGIDNFDAWAKMFGEVVNSLEISPSGSGYRVKQSFSKFKNIKALQQLFRSFADVVTEIPGLKIPKMKGGKVQIVECEAGEFQKSYMAELAKRAENVKNVDPSVDNMLKVTSDGRKISYSQRMIDPSLPYEENGKIYKCCENVYRVWQESRKTRGTQMIFCDAATPKSGSSKAQQDTASEEFAATDAGSVQLYDDIKARLVQLGIPAREIAFIHEAKNDKQKAAMAERMNKGEIRVLIGSTGKMGVGLNAQQKAVAIHHLDAPWRPGDIEQRDGRVFRQKNENEEAYKFVYVTKGSFDARLWDVLERKQKFINQILNGDDVGNEVEDTGAVTLSAAEVKAVASGSPLILEQVALEKEISRLESLQQSHNANVSRAKQRMTEDERKIAELRGKLDAAEKDLTARVDTYSSDERFSIRIGARTITDKKDAGLALVAAATAKAVEGHYTVIGKFAGFNVAVISTPEGVKGLLSGTGSYPFNIYPANTTYGINHLASVVSGIDGLVEKWNAALRETEKDLAAQRRIAAEPFEEAETLREKRSRYNEVMYELNPPTEQQIDGDEDVQYQAREYEEDDYSTDGVHWGMKAGIMTKAEARIVWEAIAKYSKQRQYYPRTINGEIIVQSDNALFFVSADYSAPTVNSIIRFDELHKMNSGYAKELIVNAGGNPTRHREALRTITDYFGDGYASEYSYREWRSNEGQNRHRKGTNSGELYYEAKKDVNSPVSQAISSAGTSIKQIPALFKDKNVRFGKTNIDIGGGKFDLATDYLTSMGTKNLVFDPYNRSEEVNSSTLAYLRSGYKADTATCANVLNVIAEAGARANVILEVAKAIKQGGTAYFMVYEGNGSGQGRQTSAGYQNNRKTADYVSEIEQYFENVQRKGKLIIATEPKSNLPKASWEISPGNAILYQDRAEALTDRDILEMAAQNVELRAADLTDGERDALQIFQNRLGTLRDLQQQRIEQGRLYREQQFGAKVDRDAARATLNRMKILDGQIKRAGEAVLDVQEKKVLKRVLQNARKIIEQKQRAKDQETLRRWRDRRNNAAAIKKYRERIRADVTDLTNWILKPSGKDTVNRVPDALKSSVIPFLQSINLMSRQQLRGGNATIADKAFEENLVKLEKVMQKATGFNPEAAYGQYADLPPDFMDTLRDFIRSAQAIMDKSNGELVINQMTADELRKLSKVVANLKQYIKTMNRFHSNAMFRHISEAGDASIDFMGQLAPAKNTGVASDFLFWQQMRPAYAFERFGEGGRAVYDELRRGQGQLAFDTKEILAFSEKAYTTQEVQAWEQEIKTIELDPNNTVTMKVSQIMSLYELSKRLQAMGHILGEGVRASTFKDGRTKISDDGRTLTPAELNKILGTLTDRQKAVADSLQQFMQKKGGAWGNYVSMARFGEQLFGEEHYFPINSDGRHLSVNADESPQAASLYALLNMSFTKQTQEKAANRIVLYSIFDVFSNHMASMAQYHAMALPVVDALKWFNYRHTDPESRMVLDSVREQMDRAFGVPEETRPGSGKRGYAQNFVIGILKAFNGTEAQGAPMDSFGLKALHKYNRAQVAYNFRVMIQQPLAITRAGAVIDYSSILRGMKCPPAVIKRNIEEMQRYSGIAAWKDLGFYDINISRGLTSLIKHDESTMDKVMETGMKGAEKADTVTWAAIWSACKEEVIRKKGLYPKDAGFYDAVTELFEEVIYKTQVVDSVLTKTAFIRDKGLFARTVGSFMSEPITSACMVLNAVDNMQMDMQRGKGFSQAWMKNRGAIGRAVYVYALGAILNAAVQAIADGLRDDDDYETFLEKWLEAFKGNFVDEILPFGKLPIVSDFYEAAKEIAAKWFKLDIYGNPPSSVFMQWYDSLIKANFILHDKLTGEDTNYTWYGGAYKLLQAVSGMTGVPLAAATREVVTAWNSIIGYMAPSLKVKTYDPGDKAEIKYAYLDGYLTEEEARQYLLEKELAENEDDAYWTVRGWNGDGETTSKYRDIYDAVRNGGDFAGAMDELTTHGVREKDALSAVKSQIGTWYQDGEITRQQADGMLSKYLDMDRDEVKAQLDRWSAKVETGIAFDDIKDEYLDESISYEDAVHFYSHYGGYTEERAEETVTKWKAEAETGIAYDDVKDAYLDGDISRTDLVTYLEKYGGKKPEEAEEAASKYTFEKETGIAYDDMKDAYLSGELSESKAISARVEYGGVEQDKAEATVSAWRFEKETGIEGASSGEVAGYYEYAMPNGITAEAYHDYYDEKTGLHADVDENGDAISGSRKVKVMALIDSLPLTPAQKDALYFAEGWAESRLYEAPWH